MRVAHVVIEDICSGLFRTQVVDIARQIVRTDPSISIDIHAINRPWKLSAHRERLAGYEDLLRGTGIRIVYSPLLPPLRSALSSAAYSRGVTLLLMSVLAARLRRTVDVVHARSNWPAMALQQLGYRNMVFDPRSLWVSENLSTGDLAPASASHRYWLHGEGACVRSAAVTTAVSAAMADYFRQEYGASNVRLIPIAFDGKVFRHSSAARARRRAEMGMSGETVYVYSGSLGMSRVNVVALRRLFGLAMADSNARLVILTEEPESAINATLEHVEGAASRVHVVRARQSEIGEWLSACDVGLHALPRQIDWRTRLGTKVVEYWACGLPVIVNEWVGAAAAYIRDEDVGRVIDESTTAERFARWTREAIALDRTRITSFARRTFAAEVVADLYRDAYARAAAAV